MPRGQYDRRKARKQAKEEGEEMMARPTPVDEGSLLPVIAVNGRPRPTVLYSPTGPTGNVFSILLRVRSAMLRVGYLEDEILAIANKATQQSYQHTIAVLGQYVDLREPTEEEVTWGRQEFGGVNIFNI